MRDPTPEEIEQLKLYTAKGRTKAQLAEWGVPWPPPKGWKRKLLGRMPDARHSPLGKIARTAALLKSRVEAIENAALAGNREDIEEFLKDADQMLVALKEKILESLVD